MVWGQTQRSTEETWLQGAMSWLWRSTTGWTHLDFCPWTRAASTAVIGLRTRSLLFNGSEATSKISEAILIRLPSLVSIRQPFSSPCREFLPEYVSSCICSNGQPAKSSKAMDPLITMLHWHEQTIGQSAGAASVRAHLASPRSAGLFAGAIMQSSPSGSYSNYYTIDQEVALSTDPIYLYRL